MSLTNFSVVNAKSKSVSYKLFDEKDLYLLVTPSGGKLWRFKYHYQGKEKLLALGKHPNISLIDVRERRDEARKLLASGFDPAQEKRKRRLSLENIKSFGKEEDIVETRIIRPTNIISPTKEMTDMEYIKLELHIIKECLKELIRNKNKE